ncbi:PHO85 cyclin-5 [Microdochium nivale]|nr:PHO85 cyclin-5 [Microdochium nivale]
MVHSNEKLLAYTSTYATHPYNASIASSASSSQTSVWSDAASQSSDDTAISVASSEALETSESYFKTIRQPTQVPQELRQNPRRTRGGASTRSGCPPVLVRQCERKHNFVDNLVDSSTQIVEAIWPCSSVIYRQELGSKAVLPLRTFIQETLRRSRTSYSTLQVALYYLILIKPHVPAHDFTMEQPEDMHVNRALQCGRRMFLAALILASKYLQDRNYSARAWSKISGLATNEINQNEIAFLLAVNWKLHITDAVFQRWTEIVLKYTPSQPPSPGAVGSLTADMEYQDWKNLILKLNPELDNIEGLIKVSPSMSKTFNLAAATSSPSLGGFLSSSRPGSSSLGLEGDATPTPRTYGAPSIMEPLPSGSYAPGRFAPALGLLPTPRLTPQMTGPSTPAASAATCLLSGRGSMGFALNQAASTSAVQNMERWYQSSETSPRGYSCLNRRSSLANSVSTASSPESMVSDTSRTSRSSSISSASSLVSAPFSNKLDVQARCRYAKLCSERYSLKPAVTSVLETFDECRMTSSPEYYTGPVAKDLLDMSLDTPSTTRGCEFDDAADAARALQDLQKYSLGFQSRPRLGAKRSSDFLQENVRDLLTRQPSSTSDREWPVAMLTSQEAFESSRKRVCYEAPSYNIPSLHPAMGGQGGPGMWAGVLN